MYWHLDEEALVPEVCSRTAQNGPGTIVCGVGIADHVSPTHGNGLGRSGENIIKFGHESILDYSIQGLRPVSCVRRRDSIVIHLSRTNLMASIKIVGCLTV